MMMVLRMVVMMRVTVMLLSEEASAASRGWHTCKVAAHRCSDSDSSF